MEISGTLHFLCFCVQLRHLTICMCQKVQWVAGDSTDPDSYRDMLDGVTDVVHTVGILMENDYKKLAQANSLGEAVNGIGSIIRQGLGMKDKGNPFKQDSKPKITFEMMNRDTGILKHPML
jgi:hypothetical protein